ncbi:hypothetical protein [Clostridium sp.]|uniref:hypothetical protein n=1 Tax=Clostridium sp. TaxID=1506 RepID=UPI002843605B|nr:hypothetical protein [Clostridium sp.]MDR3598433.1 hypothetical protein [Clostridium sp.]
MLRLTVFEFIVRTIPESLIYIFAAYLFSSTKLDVKKYIISSMLLAISTFLIRMLPINYGVHTILFIMIQTIILLSINKIDVIKAVKSTIISIICLFALETLNVLTLSFIFKDQLNEIMSNPNIKVLYGLPSLIGFIMIISCYYYINKKGKIKNV